RTRGDARPSRLIPWREPSLRRRRSLGSRSESSPAGGAAGRAPGPRWLAHREGLPLRPPAEGEHRALPAPRPPRDADLPAVEDEQVGGARPALLLDEGHELPLDLDGVVALGDAEPVRDAQHVRVDGDAFRDVV